MRTDPPRTQDPEIFEGRGTTHCRSVQPLYIDASNTDLCT